MQILFQGTIEYNGQDIAFVVNKTDNDQIEISISFVRGSNTNRATFGFNRVTENRWELDRVNTQSDIDMYLEHNPANNRWTLGSNDLNLEKVLEDGERLTIQRHGEILFDISNTISISSGRSSETNLNLNKMIEIAQEKAGFTKKLVIANLCKDFIKTIEKQALLQKGKSSNILQKKVANKNEFKAEKTKTPGEMAKTLKMPKTNSKNTILTRS